MHVVRPATRYIRYFADFYQVSRQKSPDERGTQSGTRLWRAGHAVSKEPSHLGFSSLAATSPAKRYAPACATENTRGADATLELLSRSGWSTSAKVRSSGCRPQDFPRPFLAFNGCSSGWPRHDRSLAGRWPRRAHECLHSATGGVLECGSERRMATPRSVVAHTTPTKLRFSPLRCGAGHVDRAVVTGGPHHAPPAPSSLSN